MNTVTIAGKKIGPSGPVFVIAEAGVNHNGDPALARQLVDVAAEAGADAVKFQTFTPEEIVSEKAPQAQYQVENTGKEESQIEMLRRLVLPHEEHQALKKYAEEKGLIFLSTPFSETDADFLEKLEVVAFKIPSGDLNNLPFLAHVARKKKPVILSTGMGTLQEVREAIETLRTNGAPGVAVFHCTSEYPTPPQDVNLRAMQTLAREFNLPTGLSDHTEGYTITVAAVAMGACIIEKHFTLDRTLPGPDHKASLEPHELKAMIADMRTIERALGTGVKEPTPGEIEVAKVARKSLVAVRDIKAGTSIGEQDVRILRPGTGLAPKYLTSVIGKKAAQDIARGTPITETMIS